MYMVVSYILKAYRICKRKLYKNNQAPSKNKT